MLASVIAILMMLVFPLGTISSSDAFFNISALGVNSVTEEVPLDQMSYGLLSILLIMMALPLVCIFLYKKRKTQLQILIYTAVLDFFFYGYFFLYEASRLLSMAEWALGACNLPQAVEGEYSGVLYVMPAVSIFGCVMAWKYVTYDIALLSSADRLRPSRKK